MLAHWIRFTLLLELATYGALGAWLHHAHGWTVPVLAPAVLVFALGARFALTCFTCFLGWYNRSPRQPGHELGFVDVLRYLLGEYRALLADNLYYLPWEAIALRPDPPVTPTERIPVVLVHGYLSNRGYFRSLVRWLEARDVGPIFAPNFPVLFASIENFAAELHAQIERVALGCGQPRVILVCHSMGGLAARRYLQDHGERRVARLVTIASPHHGTSLANAGMGLNARQMCRGSDFLRSLDEAETRVKPGIATLSIYTPHDNLVSPQDTSVLSWARNVAVPGLGHVEIITSERTFGVLLEELRRQDN